MADLLLRHRNTDIVELMDDPDADPGRLRRTYAQFYVLNRLLSGWRRLYVRRLRPILSTGDARILDVGCGGGDVLAHLANWAEQDGFSDARFMGVDPDARAIRFALSQPVPASVRFAQTHTTDLLAAGERFDVVISNHVVHHLSPDELSVLLRDSRQLAGRLVIHNDIRRSPVAMLLFPWTKLVFHNSFVVTDGLRSIRRSYTPQELEVAAGSPWTAERMFPFRLLLTWSASGS